MGRGAYDMTGIEEPNCDDTDPISIAINPVNTINQPDDSSLKLSSVKIPPSIPYSATIPCGQVYSNSNVTGTAPTNVQSPCTGNVSTANYTPKNPTGVSNGDVNLNGHNLHSYSINVPSQPHVSTSTPSSSATPLDLQSHQSFVSHLGVSGHPEMTSQFTHDEAQVSDVSNGPYHCQTDRSYLPPNHSSHLSLQLTNDQLTNPSDLYPPLQQVHPHSHSHPHQQMYVMQSQEHQFQSDPFMFPLPSRYPTSNSSQQIK